MSSSPQQSPKVSLRQSVSSNPDSHYSGGRNGYAESSSQAGSRASRDGGYPSTPRDRQNSATPDPESVGGKDGHLGVLRRRARRSGGFLLGSAGSSKDDDRKASQETDRKGKSKLEPTDNRKHAERARDRSSRHVDIGSSPLSRPPEDALHEHGLTANDTLDGTHGLDNHKDHDPSNAHGNHGHSGHLEVPSEVRSAAASLDPAQLVQMALSLSEGRRRHASTGLVVPSANGDTRRIRSSGAPIISVPPGSPHGNDDVQLGHYLSTPRSRSQLSQASNQSTPQDSSHSGDTLDQTVLRAEPVVEYQLSSATLARAERVRKYFELSSEYRRLLQHLPPLRPDATAPGNFTVSTKNSPGGHAQVSRIRSNTNSKHELGRPYNPLQLLRNRRVRRRERRPLDPPSGAFEDVDKVKSWLDSVETEASKPSFRTGRDTVDLPSLLPNDENHNPEPVGLPTGHRRTGTASSIISRPANDWSITPAELLADTLWVEQGDNKHYIQNRHGHIIFPSTTRASFESTRPTRRSGETQPPRLTRTETMDSTMSKADESNTERGRKKRKLLSIHRTESEKRKRFPWNAARTRSPSLSSVSSDEGSRPRKESRQPHEFDGENIGPLEKHMRRIMERDALEPHSESPELISPDKWDRTNGTMEQRFANGTPSKNKSQSKNVSPGAGDEASPPQIPEEREDLHTEDERGRSSLEAMDSTGPNSPMLENHVPPIGMSLSPPPSRRPSKHRRPHLNLSILRSTSKDRQNISQTDFAADGDISKGSSRQVSGDVTEQPRTSYESLRPSAVRRHKTTNSISATLQRSDSYLRGRRKGDEKEKEPSSTVSRFFKGGRIGELVRNEGSKLGDRVWKKDPPADARSITSENSLTASDESDTSEDEGGESRKLKRPPTNVSTSGRKSTERQRSPEKKQKYHIPNLPSFKSSDRDHVIRQQSAQSQQSQSSRFKKLALPRLNTDGVSPHTSSPDLLKTNTRTTTGSYHTADGSDGRRKSYGFLAAPTRSKDGKRGSDVSLRAPGQMGRGDGKMPMSGLAKLDSRGSDGTNRHWSISDRAIREKEQASQHQRIQMKHILHVRALFLSSGIKASELARRAESPIEPPERVPKYLIKAAETAGEDLGPVVLKDQFVVAGNLLSKATTASLAQFESALRAFHENTADGYKNRLGDLRHKVADEMTPKVHQSADEADAFVAQLTTHQTLAVKQVNDAIDAVLRSRSRHWRWLKRTGFKFLEWAVQSLLWMVWLVVVVIKLVKGSLAGVIRGIRWMLWL